MKPLIMTKIIEVLFYVNEEDTDTDSEEEEEEEEEVLD